jgi:hypothetical protein
MAGRRTHASKAGGLDELEEDAAEPVRWEALVLSVRC